MHERTTGDSGERRLSETPPPGVTLSKLDSFTTNRADEKGVILSKSDTLIRYI